METHLDSVDEKGDTPLAVLMCVRRRLQKPEKRYDWSLVATCPAGFVAFSARNGEALNLDWPNKTNPRIIQPILDIGASLPPTRRTEFTTRLALKLKWTDNWITPRSLQLTERQKQEAYAVDHFWALSEATGPIADLHPFAMRRDEYLEVVKKAIKRVQRRESRARQAERNRARRRSFSTYEAPTGFIKAAERDPEDDD